MFCGLLHRTALHTCFFLLLSVGYHLYFCFVLHNLYGRLHVKRIYFLISAYDNRGYLFSSLDVTLTRRGRRSGFDSRRAGKWKNILAVRVDSFVPSFLAFAFYLLATLVWTRDGCRKCSTILGSAFYAAPGGLATVCALRSRLFWYLSCS